MGTSWFRRCRSNRSRLLGPGDGPGHISPGPVRVALRRGQDERDLVVLRRVLPDRVRRPGGRGSCRRPGLGGAIRGGRLPGRAGDTGRVVPLPRQLLQPVPGRCPLVQHGRVLLGQRRLPVRQRRRLNTPWPWSSIEGDAPSRHVRSSAVAARGCVPSHGCHTTPSDTTGDGRSDR